MVAEITLALVVAVAVCFDLKERRIPNWLTGPGMVLGILIGWFADGPEGALGALGGAAVGVGVLFIPFAFGWIGGGDLKLLAVVGSLMGGWFALSTLAFAGVGVGLAFIMVRYLYPRQMSRWSGKFLTHSTSIPFGPAMAAGVLFSLFWK